MEGSTELEPEAVLRFLTERGGRVPHAELVRHFKSVLGGEPEQRARARARFKELVNAVATVRADPADGTKYVHLKRKFCEDCPPAEAAPLQVLPRVSGTAEPEPAAGAPGEPAEPGESALSPEETPGRGSETGDGEAHTAAPGSPERIRDGRNRRPLSAGSLNENSGPDVPPRDPALGHGGDVAPHGCEETDAGGIPREVATPKNPRQISRDLAPGSSPHLKRSASPSLGSPGSASGAGRGRGGGDSDDASVASSAEEESGGGGSVALDPLEHAWMLSAAESQWDSLEGLLSSDPGLLAKRDFITGFTCLHWAAKHGRQEVLAMLVNFANKHQQPVNINARTSGGYTALHLAAMHGHAEVVKLLVGAYDADVDARDYSGRKAAQYLSQSTAEEIKNLVGALDTDHRESTAGGGGGRWRFSKVLPSHLMAHRLSHVPEDGGDSHHPLAEGLAGGKVKDPGRKAPGGSGGRIKPRINKMRFRTQIVHTTPTFRDLDQPLEEGEEEEEEDQSLKGHSTSFKLRPKSNVFG